MTRLALILFPLALAGCVSRSPQLATPPMPPMPRHAPAQIVEDEPQQYLLPPRTITLYWDASADAAHVAHYNVYAAPVPRLGAMVKIAETPGTQWTEAANLPARFYQVTAYGTNGLESGWASK
jgi:hypothetical protein